MPEHMEAIYVALIALFGTMCSPLVLAYFVARRRHADKLEDYARQDLVAAQAAAAARLLLEANERVAAQGDVTNGKLEAIHTLVNSQMTAALQAELAATVREAAMIREVSAMRAINGLPPRGEARIALASCDLRVAELQDIIADRLRRTEIAEQQMAATT